jgi:hypothetical protein
VSFGWLFLLMSLAAYRVARFIVDDEFPPMKWLREKFTGPYAAPLDSPERQNTRVPYWLAYLFTCPWCMTVWTAGLVTLLVAVTVGVPAPLLVWLAVAAAAALTSHLEDYFTRE